MICQNKLLNARSKVVEENSKINKNQTSTSLGGITQKNED